MRYYNGLPRDAVPQRLALQDLFRELSQLKDRTMKEHSESSPREKLKFKQSDVHHMACNEVRYWKKSIMRRQHLTAKHAHPWVIEFSSQLQEDIFNHIVNIMTCVSNFGLHTHAGRPKEKIVIVTSKAKLQQLLSFCLGADQRHLRRQIAGKGKSDIIIDGQKPFIITYNSSTEVIYKGAVPLWCMEHQRCSSIYLIFLLERCVGRSPDMRHSPCLGTFKTHCTRTG